MTEWMDERPYAGPSVQPPEPLTYNPANGYRVMSDETNPRPKVGELYRDSLGNPVGIIVETSGSSVTVMTYS